MLSIPDIQNMIADAFFGYHEIAQTQVGLQRSRCAHTYQFKCAVLLFQLACVKIHIGQSVEFGHHDLDIVGAYTVG